MYYKHLDYVYLQLTRCRVPELKDQILAMLSKCGKGQGKKFMAVIKGKDHSEEPRHSNSTLNSRSKRMVKSSPERVWTLGKVPYIDGDSQGNRRAMQVFERFTCIRFYPWSKNGDTTTNDELGLDHQSYLKFIYDGG